MKRSRFQEIFRLRLRGADVAGDVEAEIAFHLEQRIARLIADGLPPDAARLEAERRFGTGRSALRQHATRTESTRFRREWFQGLRHDVRAALRMLTLRPGFTIAVLAILGIGIAANVAVFAVADHAMLRPLPFPDGDRLVMIQRNYQARDADPDITVARFHQLAAGQHALTAIAPIASRGSVSVVADGNALSLDSQLIDERYMPLLGATMAAGRSFTADEVNNAAPVVILDESVWRSSFNADRGVLGRTIRIEGTTRTVVGVAPAQVAMFNGGRASVWLPLPADESGFTMLGRIPANVTIEGAAASVGREAARVWADSKLEHSLLVRDAHTVLLGDTKPALLLLAAAVGTVLAIVCANIVNLYLVRTVGRRHEFSVRVSLGATRWRLMRQLTVECAILSAAAGVIGLFTARLLIGTIAASADRRGMLPSVTLDARSMLFALAVAGSCWLLLSLVAGLHAASTGPVHAAGVRVTAARSATRARRALVAFEVALSVMLVTGAALMLRSVYSMMQIDLGFNYSNVALAELKLPGAYDAARGAVLYDAILARLHALPGIEAAGATSTIPLGNRHSSTPFEVPTTQTDGYALYSAVTPGFLETLQVRLIDGRYLTASDSHDATGPLVVSESFARKHLPGLRAIGSTVMVGNKPQRRRIVVGVVSDVRQESLVEDMGASMYEPASMAKTVPTVLAIHYTDARVLSSLAADVRDAVHSLDGDIPVSNVATMRESVLDTIRDRRMLMRLLTAFGVVSLALALAGVHAVVSHSVAGRTREFAVRLAVGATRRDILRLVLREESIAIAAGLMIGAGGAFASTRLLSKWVFGVSTHDPLAFGAASLLLIVTGLIATTIPARRAADVDPQDVLNTA